MFEESCDLADSLDGVESFEAVTAEAGGTDDDGSCGVAVHSCFGQYRSEGFLLD